MHISVQVLPEFASDAYIHRADALMQAGSRRTFPAAAAGPAFDNYTEREPDAAAVW